MDHPGGNNTPLPVPFGHSAVFTILRSFVTRAPDADEDEDMHDLPPLEPLDAPHADTPLPDSHPVDPAFAAFAHQRTYESSMPDLQSVSDSSDSDDGDGDVDGHGHDAAMPPLQTIPDDDDGEWSDDDGDEDEDLPPLEPIAASQTQRRTAEDEDMPLLEPVVGDRRARVEDDHDEDRDRRHPSQRTGQQGPGNTGNTGNAPPFFAGIHNPGGPPPPGMIELFQTFMGGVGPPRAPAPATAGNGNGSGPTDAPRAAHAAHTAHTPNANTPPQPAPAPHAGPHPHHHRHHHHHPVPPVQFMFDLNAGAPGLAPPPGLVELLFGLQGAQDPTNPANPGDPANPNGPTTIGALQQLLERLAAMGQAFGFQMEEKEDPARAQTLVDGLEAVPVGLIRRMEKVGGAPGGHVDEATGAVEAPSCAICWDTLLNEEGAQWARKEDGEAATTPTTPTPADDNDNDQPMEGAAAETHQAPAQADVPPPEPDTDAAFDPPTPTLASTAGLNTSDPPVPAVDPPASSTSTSSEAKSKADPDSDPAAPDKIVCLPCAHVFHAACLVPWFTRPRQTTCPTCRFNVDPDNLTYVPTPVTMPTSGMSAGPAPAQAQAQAQAQGQGQAGAGAGAAPAAATPGAQDAGAEFDVQLQNFMDENPQVLAEAFGLAQPQQPPAAATAANHNPNPNPNPGQPPRAQPQPAAQFAAMFGAGGLPFTMGAVPNGWGPGNAPPGAGAGAGGQPNGFTQLMGMFRLPIPMPAPQQQQAGPAPAPAPAPAQGGPAPAPRFVPSQQQRPQAPPAGTGMFTVDFTLFSENPFEGDGVRRQANLFANQIFGGGLGGGGAAPGTAPAPAPAPGAAPGAPANPAPGAAPRTVPRFPIIPGLPPFTLGPTPAPGGRARGAHPHPHPSARPRERKTWTPPPAPGPTLRIRVEQREREVGMRCSDTSCGIGPSDEDPFPAASAAALKQLAIRPLRAGVGDGDGARVCAHTFHAACLVSAERVAGWGGEVKEEEEVEVACPSCRAVGCVPRAEWEEGVRGLV